MDIITVNNKILDHLVAHGVIKSYVLVNLDNYGKPGKSKFRNTEQLTLEFPTGEKIVIGTFCSGCAEDTFLDISSGWKECLDAV